MTPERRRSARTNEPGEHRSNFDVSGSAGDYRVASSEGAHFVLVLGLNNTETPRARAIKNWTEDDHLSRVNIRLPMGPHAVP